LKTINLERVKQMIIMHNFGDGDRITDVFVAELEDGTYAVRWDVASKSTLYWDEATLKSKSLQAQVKTVMTDDATFTGSEVFTFTDDELGLVVEEG